MVDAVQQMRSGQMKEENTTDPALDSSRVLDPASGPRCARVNDLAGLEAKFEHLAEAWKMEKMFTSSMTAIEVSDYYQAIIALGHPVVPLLIRELQREPDYWFTALHAILGEDPVPLTDRGNLTRMTEHWLAWAKKNGYVPDQPSG
jgi:hypothetical protein